MFYFNFLCEIRFGMRCEEFGRTFDSSTNDSVFEFLKISTSVLGFALKKLKCCAMLYFFRYCSTICKVRIVIAYARYITKFRNM